MRPDKDAAQPHYPPLALPHLEASGDSLLSLPSFPNATKELLDQYVQAFEKVLFHGDRIVSESSET
jgi:dTDP-4-amino-4,6-dideoxygalactose transaminase